MRYVIILFFVLIFFSCKTIESPPSMMDCVECLDHQYEQAINDTSTLLTLESGIYCLGDSVWLITDNTYWAIMDNELITVMSESPFCNLLELVD